MPHLKSGAGVAAVLLLLGGTACQNPDASPEAPRLGPTSSQSSLPPADSFEPRSDNPFFPLVPGTVYHTESQTDEGLETGDFMVTYSTKVIQGVTVRVIRDVVRLDGEVIELTHDWFAQDNLGNVWYFGEDSKTIEDGKVVSTEGSWMHGQDGAQAGIVMLAHPQVGDKYNEENAPGVAEDQAEVLSVNESIQVPYGSFSGCLRTRNTTPLEPEVVEEKVYCPGVGSVFEEDISPEQAISQLVSIAHNVHQD
jgi:hypothetical protein